MSQHRHSGQRLLCAAGIIALLGLAQPAMAQEATQSTAQALTVVKDAETGQLRAPTAAEAAALQAKAATARSAMRQAPQTILSKTHRSGLRGFRVTDDMLTMSVAVRKPDGSIERQCFEAHDGAADAKGHVHSTQAVTE